MNRKDVKVPLKRYFKIIKFEDEYRRRNFIVLEKPT